MYSCLLINFSVGLDDLLSKHIAHLFIRDPLVIFSELIHQDDSTSMDHFEVFSLYKYKLMFVIPRVVELTVN